jgi:hypothetical protein
MECTGLTGGHREPLAEALAVLATTAAELPRVTAL